MNSIFNYPNNSAVRAIAPIKLDETKACQTKVGSGGGGFNHNSLADLPVGTNQPLSDKAEHKGRMVSVNLQKDESQLFLELRQDEWDLILSMVDNTTLLSLRSVSKKAKRTVDCTYALSKIWLERFTPSLQKAIISHAEEIAGGHSCKWVHSFFEDKNALENIIKKKRHKCFPGLLFRKMNQAMNYCPYFKIEPGVDFTLGKTRCPSNFSRDSSRLVVCCDRVAHIYSIDAEGTWKHEDEKTMRARICSVTFSDNGCNLLINQDRIAVLFSKRPNNKWEKEVVLDPCYNPVQPAVFSPDSCRLSVDDPSAAIKVYCKGADERWTIKGHIGADSNPSTVRKVMFSNDGRHLIVLRTHGSVDILSEDSSGCWRKTCGINIDSYVLSADFSPDGRRLALVLVLGAGYLPTIGVYDISSEGKCVFERVVKYEPDIVKELILQHLPLVSRPQEVIFSPDSRHMVVGLNNNTADIFTFSSSDKLEMKKSIRYTKVLLPPIFSPNSRYLAVEVHNGNIEIYMMRGDDWLLSGTIKQEDDRAFTLNFSVDGKHVMVTSENPDNDIKRIKIYGKYHNLGWINKADVYYREEDNMIESSSYSIDGRRLITRGTNGSIKTYSVKKSSEDDFEKDDKEFYPESWEDTNEIWPKDALEYLFVDHSKKVPIDVWLDRDSLRFIFEDPAKKPLNKVSTDVFGKVTKESLLQTNLSFTKGNKPSISHPISPEETTCSIL